MEEQDTTQSSENTEQQLSNTQLQMPVVDNTAIVEYL